MMETTVVLKPPSEWRPKAAWYSARAPEWLQALAAAPHLARPHLSWDDLTAEMDAALQIPGTTNAWTMPIKARIDMLTTGVRTPVGIKIFGADLKQIEAIGARLEEILRGVPGTRSVFAERAAGGYFVDFDLKREALARFGLSVGDVQDVIMSAVGGENVTTTIEGRERYPVNVRYPRELRDDLDRLGRVLVMTPSGAQIPLSPGRGDPDRDRPVHDPQRERPARRLRLRRHRRQRRRRLRRARAGGRGGAEPTLPTGYSLEWSGQYENMLRVRERLKVVVPITLFLIFFLLYMNTKSAFKAGIVMLAVPFSVVGAVWLMYLLGYNVSIAAWVGMIALMGLDAETGVFMLLFLDLSYDEAKRRGPAADARRPARRPSSTAP